MMSVQFYQPLATSLLIGSLLFGCVLYFTEKNGTKPLIRKTGSRLYESKKSMGSKPLFKYIFGRLHQGRTVLPTLILSLMIFLKSVGMFLAGLILLGPLVLGIQGFFMGALKVHMKPNGIPENFNQVIISQLSGHIIAMSIGFSLGLKWLFTEGSIIETAEENLALILPLTILIIISAIVTATQEATMIKKEGISILN